MHELQLLGEEKYEPNMAKNTSVIAVVAAVNRGFLKNRRSSIGSSVCSSHQKKNAATNAPPTNASTVLDAVQPFVGASMTA